MPSLSQWGRILLFFNLALSLMFAFWALSIYRDRIDFPEEHKARQAEIDRFKKVLAPGGEDVLRGAEARWQFAQRNLKAAEERRPVLAKWYADRLENLRNGPAPVQALVHDKTGKLQVDPNTGIPLTGPVLDANGQPIPGLANLKTLDQNYTQAQNELRQTFQASDKALAQIKALNKQIGNGQEEGSLRYQLAERQDELKRSLDQHEFLQPLLYNRQVEVQILTKRHKALEARLEELKAVAVARKP